MKPTDDTNSIEKYTQPINVQSPDSAALSKLTVMNQTSVAEDSFLSVKKLTPVHGQDNPPVEDSNEPPDSVSAQIGDSPINTARGFGKENRVQFLQCGHRRGNLGIE